MENTKGLDNFINSTLGLAHGYLAKMLELEEERQNRNIELIASENYASEAVRLAMASCLTNKYAEGYSGNRFYGGCEYIDKIEDCCKQTWQRVFNTDYSVNV
jgi:glycine hydroxymethyltransferase